MSHVCKPCCIRSVQAKSVVKISKNTNPPPQQIGDQVSKGLKFTGQVTWPKIENVHVLKLEQLWTWNCRYLFWELLRTYTGNFKSLNIIISTLGYFEFLVTWLARQILNVQAIVQWALSSTFTLLVSVLIYPGGI